MGDRIEEDRRGKDTTRRNTETANLNPWVLIETNPPGWNRLDLLPIFDMQLCLHVCTLSVGVGTVSESVA